MTGEEHEGEPVPEEDRLREPSTLWVDIEGISDLLYRVWINRAFRKLIPGLVLFILLMVMPRPEGLSVEGQRTIALFVFIVYLWVTETFALPVTAFMAGIGLLVLGIYRVPEGATDAFKMYAANAVFMILGSLILAQGLISSGANRMIANGVLKRAAKNTDTLLLGIIALCALIAAVIPDHSVAAFMLPVVLSLIYATDIRHHPREVVGFTIAIAMGCAIGGVATPSGGARNAITVGYLEDYYGITVSYWEWVRLAFPLTLILIPVTFIIIKLAFKIERRPLSPVGLERTDREDYRPYLGLAVLMTTVVLYLTVSNVLSLGGVAMIGGVLMFVLGLLRWESARGDLRWGVIFIYGAALTMGEAMRATGAADWIAGGMFGSVEGITLIALILLVVLITASITNLMSAGATVTMLLPVLLPLAFRLGGGEAGDGADYAFVVGMATAMASAFAFITVFGTPRTP